MKPSSQAIDLICQFEGFRAEPYQDVGGVWTIGYGHTSPGLQWSGTITDAMARTLLAGDLQSVEAAIDHAVTAPLTQNQYDALCSFVFNVGSGAFRTSHLLYLLNQQRYADASAEFLKWDHVGNREVAGLTRRRAAEQALFTRVDGG